MSLPWSERVVMLSINPDAATRDDVAKLSADLMDRCARIAELERGLAEVIEDFKVVVAWSGDCYCLTDYEAGIAGGKECPTCAAIEGLSEIKSVLGKEAKP